MTKPTSPPLAKYEAMAATWYRAFISEKTIEGLTAAKSRGVKLGGWRGNEMPEHVRQAARISLSSTADKKSSDTMRTIVALGVKGQSLAKIANALNSAGVKTHRGKDVWQPAQIARVLKRAKSSL